MEIAMVIIALVVLLFIFCILVGKQEDERMEEICKNYMEDKKNDENNINQDNCFKTEKEAQEKLDKILEVLKGE